MFCKKITFGKANIAQKVTFRKANALTKNHIKSK